MRALTPDDDVELLSACLGEHRAFGEWDTYLRECRLDAYIPSNPSQQKWVTCPPGFVDYLELHRVTTIVFWGRNALPLRAELRAFRPLAFRVDSQWNRLMRIRFRDYVGSDNPKLRHLRRARSIEAGGFRLEVGTPHLMREYELLTRTLLPKINTDIQREIYLRLAAFAHSPGTLIFSAVKDKRLGGFLGIRQLSKSYAYFAWSATDAEFQHISDFLYAKTIEICSNEYDVLDLGYGGNEGLFAYKHKWRPTDIFPPRSYVAFSRTG